MRCQVNQTITIIVSIPKDIYANPKLNTFYFSILPSWIIIAWSPVHLWHPCCVCCCYNVVCSLVNHICAVDYKLYVPLETMNGFQSRHEIIMHRGEGIRCSNRCLLQDDSSEKGIWWSANMVSCITWTTLIFHESGLIGHAVSITRAACLVSSKGHIKMH